MKAGGGIREVSICWKLIINNVSAKIMLTHLTIIRIYTIKINISCNALETLEH